MLFSSWLRNSKRSAPAARRRTPTSPRQRASFRPRPEALEDRCLLSGYQQTNLVGYKPGIAHVHRLQLERLGHGVHAERVFRCGQHVHHRAGHVLQQLRPRAPADDHHAGSASAGLDQALGSGRSATPPASSTIRRRTS